MELLEGGELTESGDEEINRDKNEEALIDEEINDEEITAQIKRLKKKKAAGEDKIQNEALIYMEGKAKIKWMESLKQIWNEMAIPKRWRKAVISPIFKKGDNSNPSSYRGISLLDTSYKVYASILTKRISDEVEDKGLLPESQAGFRKSRSTIDNIYALNYLVEKVINQPGGVLYAFFIDFSAAFDTIDRNLLWDKMQKFGISRGLIDRVKDIYKVTTCTVRIGDIETKEFLTTKGLRQGCPLIPILFALYIADLDQVLEKGQAGGVVIGKYKVMSLAYADDIVILAKTVREMIEMLGRLERYIKKRKLYLNVEKSKMMVF